ncbi:MAG: hypothetical protein IPI30_06570 [Saprospiraceae bacterium]|nr:hypothetical protein [Candidatus Vicinibacter affinis]
MKKLAKLIANDDIKSVALPKLATGVGRFKMGRSAGQYN